MTLAQVVTLAEKAHAGQLDKSGQPYIYHPLAVRRLLLEHFPDATISEEKAALLHDVLEDTEVTLEWVEPEVVEMVQIVTRPKLTEYNYLTRPSYREWIGNILASGNRGAIRVKYCDLLHNLSPARLEGLPEEMRGTEGRYRDALKRFEEYFKGTFNEGAEGDRRDG